MSNKLSMKPAAISARARYATNKIARRKHANAYMKTRRLNDPKGERIKQRTRQKRYYQKYPKRYLLKSAHYRAQLGNLNFSITEDDFEIPNRCPWLGIKLGKVANTGNRTRAQNSPSLDRINGTRGYVPGNVEVISWRANRIKCDATLQEVVRMGKVAAEKLK